MTSFNDTIGRYNDTFIFTATNGSTFQSFTIPNKVKMVSFLIIGAGGGGGGGSQPAGAAATYAGGGGGGSGSIFSAIIPAIFLPETIYLRLGNGGNGGARAVTTGGTGTAGDTTYITMRPTINSPDLIMQLPGGSGGAGGAGGAPAGGATATVGTMYLNGPGIFVNTTAGQAGSAGSSSTPTSRQVLEGSILCGGAGGGGCTGASSSGFAGGTIAFGFQSPTLPGGSPEQNGIDGVWNWQYMFGSGGSGGGGSPNSTGTTGNGGNGAYGCGGGGGGSSRLSGLGAGGAGGRGGDALAIISVW